MTALTRMSVEVTDDDLEVLRQTVNPDLSPAELRLFALVARRSGLDIFARQIYCVKRKGRVTFQTSIDGLRSIAARSGEYDGQDPPAFSGPCGCGDAPANHPESCTVTVYRRGMSRGVAATAFWHEYKPAAGPSGEQDSMWRRMPRVMLAKVAEALALRKGFPLDPTRGTGIGGDLYTDDEMAQADHPVIAVRPSPRERLAARRAELERLSAGPVPPAPTVVEEGPADAPRLMARDDFLALAASAAVGRELIAQAAEAAFPGVPSRDYTEGHWGAVADRLGLGPARADIEVVEP